VRLALDVAAAAVVVAVVVVAVVLGEWAPVVVWGEVLKEK